MNGNGSDPAAVSDLRSQGWWWVGNDTLDHCAKSVGPSAWLVYCCLCRLVGSRRNGDAAMSLLTEVTGVSAATVVKDLRILEDNGLVRIIPQQAPDGRTLANRYELLEPVLVGKNKVDIKGTNSNGALDIKAGANGNGAGQVQAPDLWALRPLDAAIAELPGSHNRLAIVARLYAMRFDADTWPFDFARMGALAKKVSGGATTLCRAVWHVNPEAIHGSPIDYVTSMLLRDAKSSVAQAARRAEVDPQMRVLEQARRNGR